MIENKDNEKDVFNKDTEDSQTNNEDDAQNANEQDKTDDENKSGINNDEKKNIEEQEVKKTGFEKLSVPALTQSEKPVKIKLLHLEGSRKGRIDIIELTSLPDMICTIGRDPECVLAFDPYKDQRVSSIHARIIYLPKDDEIFIEDLNSTNGTRINGIKIYEMTRLRDGDEVELGRKGASFEVSRIRLESEEAEIKKFQRIARKNGGENLTLNDAVFKAKDEGRESVRLIKEMVKQVSTETNANSKLLLIAMAIVIVVLLVGLITVITILINELNNDESKIIERDKSLIEEIEKNKTDSEGNGNGSDVKIVKIEDKFRTNYENEKDNVVAENQIRNNPGTTRFKEVNKESREAIYLIVSTIELQDDKGGKLLATSSGTGFVVTKDGHLVTNKHVVMPWLFEELARKIRINNMKILSETHNIMAWKTGAEALTKSGEWRESTSFSMARGQLKIANEGFNSFMMAEDPEVGEFRVHCNDSHDIIMLKLAGDNFKFLELYDSENSPDWEPEQLDNCLVIGYPQGKKTLESTKAETAPTTGQIRKIEDTIAISASVLKGNSGGPVIVIDTTQDKPLVIGVASKVAKNTETYGICIKSEYILDLLPQEYR